MKTLTLPKRLMYTACRLAVAGTLACGCGSDSTTRDATGADARADALVDAIIDAGGADRLIVDGMGDGCAADFFCAPSGQIDGATCPGLICNPQDCPTPACEIFT